MYSVNKCHEVTRTHVSHMKALAIAAVIPEAVSFIVSPTAVAAVTEYCGGCRLSMRYSCHDKGDSRQPALT